jgi:predicted phosphodiesterase
VVHRDIVALAYSFRPQLTLHTGDLVTAGSSDADWDCFFAIERPLLNSSVFLPAIGNHEETDQRYFDLFALPEGSGTEEYYRVKYNQALFLVLSTETMSDLTQDTAQNAWLEASLAEADADPDISWKIVAFHQPAFSSSFHGSREDIQSAWHQLFVDYGVDIVFSGHDHNFEHSLVDGVHYVVTGGGGGPLHPAGSSPWTIYSESEYHVVVVDVDSELLSATAYRTDRSVLHAFSL